MTGSSLGPKLRPQGRENIRDSRLHTQPLWSMWVSPFPVPLSTPCVRLPDGPCPQTLPRALPSGEGGIPRVPCCLLLTCRSGMQAPRDIQEGKIRENHHHFGCSCSFNPQPQSAATVYISENWANCFTAFRVVSVTAGKTGQSVLTLWGPLDGISRLRTLCPQVHPSPQRVTSAVLLWT